jgi:hypothetical protein
MGKRESYNAFFPKESFLAKVRSPVPDWMVAQLEADFKDVLPITADQVDRACKTIMQRVDQNPECCCHYRIIDNELYKYYERENSCSSRDWGLEKAFKTLLSHIRVPDVDFLVIPMDGIPETCMPADFYLMENPREQVPIFGQAKLKEPLTRSVVLIPDQITLSESWYSIAEEMRSVNDTISWSQKKGKAFWRGGTGDVPIAEQENERFAPTPRWNLCRLAKQHPEWVDSLFYKGDSPMLCKRIEQEGLFSSFVSKREHLCYKYLPNLNGHMCSYPGLHWRLFSDSLTLMQESDQIQWFYSGLKPYQHYLPIANDMSDVIEKIKWAELHEPEVLTMIQNARQFVSENLMYEDCYRYLYLALQKYAAYQQIDFADLKQRTKADPHWVNIQYRKRAEFFKLLHRKGEKVKRVFLSFTGESPC